MDNLQGAFKWAGVSVSVCQSVDKFDFLVIPAEAGIQKGRNKPLGLVPK